MTITWKHILSFIACIVIGIIIGLCMKSCSAGPVVEPQPIHDTIFRTDTLIVPKTKIRYVTKTDTAVIIRTETKTDTIVVELPIEHKEYSDSIVTDSSNIKWDVRYHGYRAAIDTFGISYEIQPSVRVVEKDKGWSSFIGIGIGIGGGIGYIDGHLQPTPQAGLHLVYGWGYHYKRIKK